MARIFLLTSLACLYLAPLAGAISFTGSYKTKTLADGLFLPVQAAWAPDGRIFIAEKQGTLKVANPGSKTAKVVCEFSHLVGNEGDRGFLGIAIDPDFAENGYVYLLYTALVNPGAQEVRRLENLQEYLSAQTISSKILRTLKP